MNIRYVDSVNLADDAVTIEKLAATGTASATTFLRGDNTWAVPTTGTLGDDSVDSDNYVDGSIDTAHLAADAVTGAKIADDAIDSEHYVDGSIDNAHIADDAIDSEHYAAGSIDTAHIADDQITNAKMADDAVGVAQLSATGTASSATFLRGDNTWSSGGLGVAQTFRQTSDAANGATSIVIGASSFEEADQSGYTGLPSSSGITQSSGVFTFPSTGTYLVLASVRSSQAQTLYSYTNIQYSSDSGSNWTTQSQGVMMYHVIATYADNQCHALVNIANVSTNRVRVTFDCSNTSVTVYGDSTFNETYVTLIKVA